MKIVSIIARILLGLLFFVFGLDGFLNFIHAPLPPGLAGTFLNTLVVSHFVYFISVVEVVAGLLLLANQFLPLAVALLAPIFYNILAFHVTMQFAGLPMAVIPFILWLIVAWRVRDYFAPLFVQKAVEK